MKYQTTKIRSHRCFRDTTLKWYQIELKRKHYHILKQNHELNKWNKKFVVRFKMNQSETLNLFTKNIYTIENVRSKRSIDFYVQQVTRHAKNVDFILINNKLNWIWMNLVAFLQRDINSFSDNIIITTFIKLLKHKQFTWKRFYRMKFFSITNQKALRIAIITYIKLIR